MKKLLIALLFTISTSGWAAGVAGWMFTYWDYNGTYTGPIAAINWNNVYTGGGYNNYIYGYVKWPGTLGTSKTVSFAAGYDDGHTLKANGVTVASGPCCQTTYGSYTAKGGDIVKLEFWSNNFGGGIYTAFVKWDPQGDGTYELLTNASIATDPTFWPPPNPTVVGSSYGISAAQLTTRNAAFARRDSYSGNGIYVDQIGDSNTISIVQDGNLNSVRGVNGGTAALTGNYNTVDIRQGRTGKTGTNTVELNYNGNTNNIKIYQDRLADGTADLAGFGDHTTRLSILGSNNTASVVQRNTTSVAEGNYADININGNTNIVNATQTGNYTKSLIINVTGSSDTINATQTGNAQHYGEIKLTGNNHNVTLDQSGNAAHRSSIDLTNSGFGGTVSVTQSGNTAQSYSIQQSCITAGCGATIRQGN